MRYTSKYVLASGAREALRSRLMKTELVYVSLSVPEIERLLEASEESGRSIKRLIKEAVAEFLDEKRREGVVRKFTHDGSA